MEAGLERGGGRCEPDIVAGWSGGFCGACVGAAMARGGWLRVLFLMAMVLCVVTFPGRVGAWGADGHHATCLLAEVDLGFFCFGDVC